MISLARPDPVSEATFAPPHWRGIFLWGRATKKNPEQLSVQPCAAQLGTALDVRLALALKPANVGFGFADQFGR